MIKRITSILATSTLLAATGLALAGPPAELGFDRNRMFFRYIAGGVDSGDFQVLPDNLHDPIVLPCNVENFGGGYDLDYTGAGPNVFPRVTITVFNGPSQVFPGGNPNIPVWQGLNPMPAGTVQPDGYWVVDAGYAFLFQPSDLPADTVMRVHLAVAAYPDGTYSGAPLADPDLSNNAHDIYVRRSCGCP